MGTTLETLRADYAVNRRLIDKITVTVFRINQAAYRGRARRAKRLVAKAIDVAWMQFVVGADMPGAVQCGPGLRLPHGGRGVALDPRAVIGSNVALFPMSGVGRGGRDRLVPVLKDGATLYRGALAAGPITIGENASVGANSVALTDVPAGTTVIGVPAVIPTK
jgi:serine O-acetyltransferase